MDVQKLRSLGSQHRALVAIAVLLDGREAVRYLEGDSAHGGALAKAAQDVAELPSDLRIPLLGTTHRAAVREMMSRSRRR